MKIGTYATPYLKKYGVEAGYRRIAELGYECIDFGDFCNTDVPLFQMNDADFECELNTLRRLFVALGLKVSQTHGPWRYPMNDATPEARLERFEKMSRSIIGTALLESPCMVIHPIMPFGHSEGVHGRESWEINIEFLGRLAEVGRQNGVTVCLENMPFRFHCTSTPEAILKLVKEINHPNLKICLDTGHAMTMGIQPANALLQLGADYVKALHVHDNDGDRDWHWIPFNGMIDWDAFAAALRETGYNGVLSMETAVPAQFPDTLRGLQEESLVRTALYLAGRL
ncbi:MAG: sugar phosphate isomerase/epimerase [Victivallales bacterium]|nr:sugar phosphate isomerase/epimerase [Victivallales bacterium]